VNVMLFVVRSLDEATGFGESIMVIDLRSFPVFAHTSEIDVLLYSGNGFFESWLRFFYLFHLFWFDNLLFFR